MKIEIKSGLKKLSPTSTEKYLVKKEELEKPLEERYYFKEAYLPPDRTIEDCEKIYEETELPEMK